MAYVSRTQILLDTCIILIWWLETKMSCWMYKFARIQWWGMERLDFLKKKFVVSSFTYRNFKFKFEAYKAKLSSTDSLWHYGQSLEEFSFKLQKRVTMFLLAISLKNKTPLTRCLAKVFLKRIMNRLSGCHHLIFRLDTCPSPFVAIRYILEWIKPPFHRLCSDQLHFGSSW